MPSQGLASAHNARCGYLARSAARGEREQSDRFVRPFASVDDHLQAKGGALPSTHRDGGQHGFVALVRSQATRLTGDDSIDLNDHSHRLCAGSNEDAPRPRCGQQ
jgi:hypothetical protein